MYLIDKLNFNIVVQKSYITERFHIENGEDFIIFPQMNR